MKDMRDFVKVAEENGALKRITAEVDWNLELSHIAKLNEEKHGPALLFENVKDYSTPVITSVCTTTERLALIMGMDKESSLTQIIRLGYLVESMHIDGLKQRLLYGSDWPLQFYPLIHPLYHLPHIDIGEARAITKLDNPWDRDVAIKESLGVPESVFLRSERLLREDTP